MTDDRLPDDPFRSSLGPRFDTFSDASLLWAALLELRWTPLSSAWVELVLVWSVMAGLLGLGGRRDGNDNWSL